MEVWGSGNIVIVLKGSFPFFILTNKKKDFTFINVTVTQNFFIAF